PSRPAEFPGLNEASPWIISTQPPAPSLCAARFLPVPLTTPAVTLGSEFAGINPYGFPIALAHSPISRLLDEPSGAAGRLRASVLSTARSFVSSMPTRRAG